MSAGSAGGGIQREGKTGEGTLGESLGAGLQQDKSGRSMGPSTDVQSADCAGGSIQTEAMTDKGARKLRMGQQLPVVQTWQPQEGLYRLSESECQPWVTRQDKNHPSPSQPG